MMPKQAIRPNGRGDQRISNLYRRYRDAMRKAGECPHTHPRQLREMMPSKAASLTSDTENRVTFIHRLRSRDELREFGYLQTSHQR